MTTYYVQVVTDDGEAIGPPLRTDDYHAVEGLAGVAYRKGLTIREPWADMTTIDERESWVETLIYMSKAHKDGAGEVSL